jgi:hypothetical protein
MILRFYLSLTGLCLAACSLLVSPEKGPIQCKITDGQDPCPPASTCVDDECKPSSCGESSEICDDGIDNDCDHRVDEHNASIKDIDCDGEDDDCDGKVDEDIKAEPESCDGRDNNCNEETDEGFDQDDDGFFVCGKSGDWKTEQDCEDTSKAAHPGGREVCDGLDNDCDGDPDEGSLCPADQLCLRGSCTRRSCALPDSGVVCSSSQTCVNGECEEKDCSIACKDNQFCDKATNTCADLPQPHKNGDSCMVDTDCASSVCIDAAAFKLGPSAPKRVCGAACCVDSDCPGSGEGCFTSATGARSCLPRALAVNVTTLAGMTAAATCTASNDCASSGGVCSAGEAFQGTSRVATSVCRKPLARENSYGQGCNIDFLETCNTRLCMPLVISRVCTTPCRTTADCGKLKEYNASLRGFCQYVELNGYNDMLPGGGYAPICLAKIEDVAPPTPPTCRSNNDCPDGTCLGASSNPLRPGRCAPTCCSNTHCSGGARCLPVARGTGRFEMRCVAPQ